MALIARFGLRFNDIRSAECTATELVGDFVYLTDYIGGRDQVRWADPKDYSKLPAVGAIISKSSDTTCLVQWMGETPEIYAGLAPGEIYFLGLNGKAAALPPAATTVPVFVQPIGIALSDKKMYVRTESNLTRRVP
jgi:hypothetical protein